MIYGWMHDCMYVHRHKQTCSIYIHLNMEPSCITKSQLWRSQSFISHIFLVTGSLGMWVMCSMKKWSQSLLCGNSYAVCQLWWRAVCWVSCRWLRSVINSHGMWPLLPVASVLWSLSVPESPGVSINLVTRGPQNLALTGKLTHLPQ
jgi:hypothetical protein